MGWLPSAALLLLGGLWLAVAACRLLGRLRRERAAAATLRASVDAGSARLRVARALITESARARGDARYSGRNA